MSKPTIAAPADSVVDLGRAFQQEIQDASPRVKPGGRERCANALDLSHDDAFGALLARRAELKEIERTAKAAETERKMIDAKIIERLENAETAFGPDGMLVSAPVIRRKEYTVPATVYRQVKVEVELI